jgi:low affinity Fe/Cu permease
MPRTRSSHRSRSSQPVKIDELIRAHPGARNRLMAGETATEAEIEEDERAMLERATERSERRRRHAARKSTEGAAKGETRRRHD